MTVEIICGDISALPSSDHATELLPLTDGDTLTLSCTDSDLKAAYRVLRASMDYGYEHAQPRKSQNTKIKKEKTSEFSLVFFS